MLHYILNGGRPADVDIGTVLAHEDSGLKLICRLNTIVGKLFTAELPKEYAEGVDIDRTTVADFDSVGVETQLGRP